MSIPKQRADAINYFALGFVQVFEIEQAAVAALVMVHCVADMIPEDTKDAFALQCRAIAKAGIDADVVPTGEKSEAVKNAEAIGDLCAKSIPSTELLAIASIVLERAASLSGSKLPPRVDVAVKRAAAMTVAMGKATREIQNAEPRIVRPGNGN